jgi:uncharacterized protein
MKNPCCSIKLADLPTTIPIFPLADVLLLPRGELPLHVFEPRYIAMVNDALANPARLIGIIQPSTNHAHELYQIGCVGRITNFSELEDGGYHLTLRGVCRFAVTQESELAHGGYRRVIPDYQSFARDLDQCPTLNLDRDRLLTLLKGYFAAEGMSCRWESVKNIADEPLMTALSMACPLSGPEKQALLEAPCALTRAQMFMDILAMAVSGKTSSERH